MTYATREFHPEEVYSLAAPKRPRPIMVIGAGGIVRDAHLPAYRKASYPVIGICDLVLPKAHALAREYGIGGVYSRVAEAVAAASPDTIFDIALMPEQHATVLEQLPDGSAVLLQKPLGNHLRDGAAVLELCHRKQLIAAVNTQLRFCPYIAVARDSIASGTIGELYDLEIRVQVRTPWEMFPEALKLDRLELNMHSVHYMDLARSFLGDPDGVSAITVSNPGKSTKNTRSDIALYYHGRPIRVVISTNHDHHFGPKYEESYIKWEGTKGAIRAQMGLLLDYPRGGDDLLEIQLNSEAEQGWRPLPFEGSWFPDAFIGSMGALQRFVEGSVPVLANSVDDVYRTMAVVEAGYESNAAGGTPPRYEPSL